MLDDSFTIQLHKGYMEDSIGESYVMIYGMKEDPTQRIWQMPVRSFKAMVDVHISVASIIRQLGLTNHKAKARQQLALRAANLDIELPNESGYRVHRAFLDRDVFTLNTPVQEATVKNRLRLSQLIPYKCVCGINSWNGSVLSLRLIYLNKNKKDCRIENLQWLCPNCHSQL